MDLLYVPFKGTTLFGGELAELQKANTDHANAFKKCSPLQQRPRPPILSSLTWAKAGIVTSREVFHKGEEGRRHDRSAPSATSPRTVQGIDS